MKLFIKATFLLLFIGCFLNLSGQTNFIQGFIITNDNDTLKGLIDYRGDVRNSKRCEFKEYENSPIREFLPFSIKGYRYTDSKFYISKNVLTNGKEFPIFLEFLVDGISDLYFYSDGKNFHYYIEKADGKLFELTNELRYYDQDGITYSSNTNKYIGLLKLAFADCNQLYPMINSAKLEAKSLIEITKKYHYYVCNDEKCIIYEKQLPVIKVKFGAFVSMNGSFLKFSENSIYQNVSFDGASFPTIGLLLNTSMPRANEKLSFQLSGEFGKCYFHGKGFNPIYSANSTFEEVQIHTSIVKVKAGFKYTYPKGRIRPTLLIGINIIKFINTDGRRMEDILINSNVFTSEWRDVPHFDFPWGINMEAGINYHHTASFVSFLKLGYENSSAKQGSMYKKTGSIHINTISLNAGIYF
jgi:hypothetical protein